MNSFILVVNEQNFVFILFDCCSPGFCLKQQYDVTKLNTDNHGNYYIDVIRVAAGDPPFPLVTGFNLTISVI